MIHFPAVCLLAVLCVPMAETFTFNDTDSDTDVDQNFTNSIWPDMNSTEVETNYTDFNSSSSDFNIRYPDDSNVTGFDPNVTVNGDQHVTYHADPEMDWVVREHLFHCGSETVCTVFDDLPNINNTVALTERCAPCSCDEHRCLVDKGRDCCPDVYPRLYQAAPEPSLTQCEAVMFPLSVYSPASQIQPRALINKCPDNVTEFMVETALKCHTSYWELWNSGLQEDAIPVTDRSNPTHHYKNVYCALCHGLDKSNFVLWQIQVLSDIVILPELSMSDTVLEDLWSLINTYFYYIYVQFQPPAIVPENSVACYINNCNVTGMWRIYDDKTERACHLYHHGFNKAFANVFCSMCNGMMELGSILIEYPFTVLLDVQKRDTSKEEQMAGTILPTGCQSGYIYDSLYRVCREFWCNYMFMPVNDECITTVQDIQGYGIDKFVFFKLTHPEQLTDDFWNHINISFIARLYEVIQEINTTRGYELDLIKTSYSATVNVTYTLDEKNQPVIHDVHILQFLFLLTLKPRKKPYFSSETAVRLIDSLDMLDRCDSYSDLFEDQIQCTSVYWYNINLPRNSNEIKKKIDQIFTTYQGDVQQIIVENDHNLQSNTKNPYQYIVTDSYSISDQWHMVEPGTLLIFKNHTCPSLVFYKTEFVETQSGIYFPIANKTIPYRFVIILDHNSLSLCVDAYNALILDVPDQVSQKSSTISSSTLYSVVCCGLSVLFLAFTIIYYSCNHDNYSCIHDNHSCNHDNHRCNHDKQTSSRLTRNSTSIQPGWMLVQLCASLLLAQIISIIISSLHISSKLCQVLGLTLHFCQLTYLFWINVSTYHLYKAFTSDPQSSTLGSVPVWYNVYVYSGATVFVLINIAVQLATSQGEDIGYGGSVCFVATSYMIGITFLLPLFAVFCASMVINTLVILQPPQQPNTTMVQKSSLKWLRTFFKLSALTSLTWLFDLVHQWTDINLFFYVFVILNAGQGLFIFGAFVINRSGLNFIKKSSSQKHTE